MSLACSKDKSRLTVASEEEERWSEGGGARSCRALQLMGKGLGIILHVLRSHWSAFGKKQEDLVTISSPRLLCAFSPAQGTVTSSSLNFALCFWSFSSVQVEGNCSGFSKLRVLSPVFQGSLWYPTAPLLCSQPVLAVSHTFRCVLGEKLWQITFLYISHVYET